MLCDSIDEAVRLIEQRKLDEVIASEIQEVDVMPDYRSLNHYEFLTNLPEILHTTSFLSYLALRSQTVHIDDVLGDEGVLHELTHLMTKTISIDEDSLCLIRTKLHQLQSRTIGLY
ncbi:hypothetical protein GCM10027423_45700 [Spirosoma arcticum]